MPRTVRNFWIELDVDGRKNRIETGPRSKDGGFSMTINIRDKGIIAENTLMRVVGRANKAGLLRLTAYSTADAGDVINILTTRD